jgi:hypothetical protein
VGASLRSGTESRGPTVGVDRKVRVGSRDCNFTIAIDHVIKTKQEKDFLLLLRHDIYTM